MDDRQIVDLYWQRNEAAITETERKYGRYCFSIANHILRDTEDARECVNDTYLGAWNAIPPIVRRYCHPSSGRSPGAFL